MPSHLVTHRQLFSRVELDEDDFEGLLKTWSEHLFTGFRWYHFKPTILSPDGATHPDAALVATSGDEWWVVEVEITRHSIRHHVESQLQRLEGGLYCPAGANYLIANYPHDAAFLQSIRHRAPRFLLIVDDRSTMHARVAADYGFEILHVLPYLSALPQLYAGAVEGFSPARGRRISTRGIVFEPVGQESPVQLRCVAADLLPALPDRVMVGSRLVRLRTERDSLGIVLSMASTELFSILGDHTHYVLRLEDGGTTTLIAMPKLGG